MGAPAHSWPIQGYRKRRDTLDACWWKGHFRWEDHPGPCPSSGFQEQSRCHASFRSSQPRKEHPCKAGVQACPWRLRFSLVALRTCLLSSWPSYPPWVEGRGQHSIGNTAPELSGPPAYSQRLTDPCSWSLGAC